MQTVISYQTILPPASQVTAALAVPSGFVWILAIRSMGPVRDVATGNPITTPLVYLTGRHSMLSTTGIAFALESDYKTSWAIEIDVRVNDPLVSTVVNATALTIMFDTTMAVMEITEDNYEKYLRLWDGIYNLQHLLGGLQHNDLENLLNILKILVPQPPLISDSSTQEVITHPSMAEELGKKIKRFEIP